MIVVPVHNHPKNTVIQYNLFAPLLIDEKLIFEGS